MLIRQLVARHLSSGSDVLVAADAEGFPDLVRVAEPTPLDKATVRDGDVVLVDIDNLAVASDEWRSRAPSELADLTVVLLLRTTAVELPVGRVVQEASEHDLQFLEIVALEGPGPYRTGVVTVYGASDRTAYAYLRGVQTTSQPRALHWRVTWEWGLEGFASRALLAAAEARIGQLEEELGNRERALAETQERASAAQESNEEARQHAARWKAEAERERRLRQRVESSKAYVITRTVARAIKAPVRMVRSWRARQD